MDVEKLVNDEVFRSQLENAKDLKEVTTILTAYGIKATEKEIEAAIAEVESGELDETALDDVAGGAVKIKGILNVIKKS